MQFDFSIPANGAQVVDVVGRFVKYVGGTGKIRVRMNTGGYLDLLPGQGATGLDFARLQIEDRSGAANIGVLLAGNFQFQDDRISGEVSIIDGGKSRSMSQVAFIAGQGTTANAGQYPASQLFNPAGSGKNLIVQGFAGSSNSAGNLFMVGSTQILATAAQPGQKYVKASPYTGVAQLRSESLATTPTNTGQVFLTANVAAGGACEMKLHEPVILAPGYGLTFYSLTLGSIIFTNFEYFEDSL